MDTDRFADYARKTAEKFIKYPWYYMPVSVHKVLMHGKSVIEHHLLPIGRREAQEARNKDFKNFRRNYSRKMSQSKRGSSSYAIGLV